MVRFYLALAIILFFLPLSANGGLFVDGNILYLSDGLKTSSATDTWGKTFYDFTVGFGIDKKDMYQVGWNYGSYATTDTVSSTTTTYVSTQMGPKFIVYLGKDRSWRTSFAYNISTSANYKAGTAASEKWKGVGMAADFGYQFRFGDGLSFGVRLNYSSTTYNEVLIGTTYSTSSIIRTIIYPSAAFTFDF